MKLSQIILIFYNDGEKMFKNFNQGKTNEFFFFNEIKRAESRSRKCCYRKMMSAIMYRISKCFSKESFYGMVWYAILCYRMVWKVWYAMRFQCYAMRFLCYAMVWFML